MAFFTKAVYGLQIWLLFWLFKSRRFVINTKRQAIVVEVANYFEAIRKALNSGNERHDNQRDTLFRNLDKNCKPLTLIFIRIYLQRALKKSPGPLMR